MTQEDKEILLKDLCGRLPYGVCVEHTSGFSGTLHDITVYFTYNDDDTIKDYMCYTDFFGDESCKIEFFKPYLFPLSSMTEEQKEEYYHIVNYISPDDTENWAEGEFIYVDTTQFLRLINFYHRNHLDYRGLINGGLALDATGKNIY